MKKTIKFMTLPGVANKIVFYEQDYIQRTVMINYMKIGMHDYIAASKEDIQGLVMKEF